MTDLDMFIHHALSRGFGEQEPLASFDEGIHEDVLALPGTTVRRLLSWFSWV